MSQINEEQPQSPFSLSYDEVCDYIHLRKAGRGDVPHVRAVIDHLRSVLGSRDFIFFIDDSASMGEGRTQVRQAFKTYTYLVKQICKNGFEVGFSSHPERLRNFSKTSKAVDAFDGQDWNTSNFEKSFCEFVDTSIIKRLSSPLKYLGRKPTPLSIFVLTDGNWGISGDSSIERSILRMVHELDDRSLDHFHLMFQFLRFGDNEDGIRHLLKLANAGSTAKRHIVDTSKYDADVRRIIPERRSLEEHLAARERDLQLEQQLAAIKKDLKLGGKRAARKKKFFRGMGRIDKVALPAQHPISQPAASSLGLGEKSAVKRKKFSGGMGRIDKVALPAQHPISQPAASSPAPDADTGTEIGPAYSSEWFKSQRESTGAASEDEEIRPEGAVAVPDIPATADATKTTTLSRTRTHIKYPAYTLPLFVGGLLDIWGLHMTSPPTPTSSLRHTWHCECGIQLFEEVSQLWPAEAERQEQARSELLDSESQSLGQSLGAILTKAQQAVSATIDITCEAFKGLVPPKSNESGSSLPLHSTNPNTGGRAGQQNAQPDTWLLLCIDKGPRRASFYQELFLDISNDQALFDFLRDKYFAHRKFRSWFTLRSMQSLALAQFQIDASSYPDIMEHHRYCLQRGGDCDCIPPADRVGEAREYRCSPAPAEPPRTVPALTSNRLTQYFLRPHKCVERQTFILKQLPKRSGPPLKAPPGKLAEGWGLHFQEGWNWPSVAFICALFTFIGIVFGVIWSALTADIQSGFAVTAIFVALPLLPLAFMFNRDSL